MEVLFEQIWFKKGFNIYKPNTEVLKNISKYINNYTIHIYVSLDCKDVELLIPKFFRILNELRFKSYKIKYLEKQKLPYHTINNETISKVPTIIFYNSSNIEKGRIIESLIMPTIEGEILQIINY